jgi:uncharacterized cupin superfamily protein
MSHNHNTIAIHANDIPARTIRSIYPEPFASQMAGREKRQLGEFFAIKNFGVNLTRLEPGAQSALLHRHSLQEEFIYILEGEPTLITDTDEIPLHPGMCAGFIPSDPAHYLVNRTDKPVIYLEVGDRTQGDKVTYSKDDLTAHLNEAGQWCFAHKDGKPY